jgi:hypothetical protein
LSSPAEQISSASVSRGGGRAFGLGPHRIARVGGVVLGLVLLVVLVGVLLTGHSDSAAKHGRTPSTHGEVAATHSASVAKYGGIPSWLPKATVPVNRTIRASPAHPVLAIQGNTVSVVLARGRVLATAVGPSVPEDGRFPVPATSPCTFIVTFAASSGVIPLSAKAFTLVDEFGHVRDPRVTAMGGGAPPRQALPGRPVSLKVYDVLPTGDGGLTWAPEGRRPIVSWDFDVEID